MPYQIYKIKKQEKILNFIKYSSFILFYDGNAIMQKNIYEEEDKCIIIFNTNKFTASVEFFNLNLHILIKENNILHLFNKNGQKVEQSISIDGSYKHIELFRQKIYFLYENEMKIFTEEFKNSFSTLPIRKNFQESIVSFTLIDYVYYFITESGIVYRSEYENIILVEPLRLMAEPENFYFERAEKIVGGKFKGRKFLLIKYETGVELYRLSLNNNLQFIFFLKERVEKIEYFAEKIFLLGKKLYVIDDFLQPKILYEDYIATLTGNIFISQNHINVVEYSSHMGTYPMKIKTGDIKMTIEKLFEKLNRFRNSVVGSTPVDEVKNLYLLYLKEIFDTLDAKERVNCVKAKIILEQSEKIIEQVNAINRRQAELIKKFNFFIKKNRITVSNKNYQLEQKDGKSLAILKEQNAILKRLICKNLF